MTAKNCPAWTVRTMYLNLPKVWATSPPILYCAFHVVGLLTQMSAEMSSQKQFLDADHCLNIRRCVIVNRWLGNNLFWHRNGSNLTGILFAGRVPDTPNVCQSWQSLKTKVFVIPRMFWWNIEILTSRACNWVKWLISQGSRDRIVGILYLGKSGSS